MTKTTTITIAFLLLISLVSASSFQTKVQLEIDSITGVSELDNSDGTSLLITITNSTGVVVSRNAEEGIYNAGDIIAITGEKFSLDYATDYTYNLSTSYGDFIYSFSTPAEATGGGVEYRHCVDEGNCDNTNACQSRMTVDDYWWNSTNWISGRQGESCGYLLYVCENGECGGTEGANCTVNSDCLGGYECNASGVCGCSLLTWSSSIHTTRECSIEGGIVYDTGVTGTICRLAGDAPLDVPTEWLQAANWQRYSASGTGGDNCGLWKTNVPTTWSNVPAYSYAKVGDKVWGSPCAGYSCATVGDRELWCETCLRDGYWYPTCGHAYAVGTYINLLPYRVEVGIY